MRKPRLRTVVIGAGATLALVAGTSAAAYAVTASPVNGSGRIHACYYPANSAGSHKVVLQDVGRSCPSGTTAIKWNEQGPAGTVHGYVDTSSGSTSLNTGLTTVATLNLPAGSFLVTAKAVVFAGSALTTNDTIGCYLTDGGGNAVDQAFTQLDFVNSDTYNQETVAMTGATTSGGLMQLRCVDAASEASVNRTSITAVPVASVINAGPMHQVHMRSGAAASRAGR